MATFRVAVVGAGGIARRFHLPALKRLAEEVEGLELACVCDVQEERAREAAERFGFARTSVDYRSVPDDVAPDAVWALVPYPVMREVAGYFLARGVPTLMEKPPAVSADEARALLEVASSHGTLNQVAFNRRYAPLIGRVVALAREAGPVKAVSCQFYRYNRREDAFLYGTGIHGLDTVRFLGPSEVQEVHVRRGQQGSALVTLVFEGGELGHLEILPQVGVQMERYSVHAGDRTVVADGVVNWLTHYPGTLRVYDLGRQTLSEDARDDGGAPEIAGGFYGEGAAFLRALLEGRVPTPSLAEALRSVEIAQAVLEGRSVRFS